MSDDPWFIYKRESGRFKAAPANWQGWFTFLGGIAVTVGSGISIMTMTESYPFILRFVALNAVILAGIGAILLVALRKGRPSR